MKKVLIGVGVLFVLLVAAGHWFLQWCPADVVEEHIRTLGLRGRVA